MSEKVLKAEGFKADGILVMKDDIEGKWQVASVNQWIKNGNEIAELFASAPRLKAENERMKRILKQINIIMHETNSINSGHKYISTCGNIQIYTDEFNEEALQGDEG